MMSEKRFRVNDLVKYVYSDIGEYVDEKHTDTPLRNDEVCKILNEQQASINELEETNKAMYNRLKEQSEIIYRLIQELKEYMTEKELNKLMEDVER